MINVFQPRVEDAELSAVEAVFASNWLGAGVRVEQFEQAFAAYVGLPAEQLATVSSGTEALFHAVAALGLGPGDDVVLPTISFVGAAHAVTAVGARVVLCDVDPVTLNPTVAHLESALTPATRMVLLLHYGGAPGDVLAIAELARERSLLLFEDSALGLGSFVDGRACGTFGNLAIWSFDSMKAVTTGDGGMVWCSDTDILSRVRLSTKLGLGPSGFVHRFDRERWWEIDPLEPGRRASMNDIAAAIGLAQLQRLPTFLERRAQIAATYDAGLHALSWIKAIGEHEPGAARTFYWLQTEPALRSRLAAHLLERDVYTTFKYWPLHRTSMYGARDCRFPGADRGADSTLLLPIHQGLRNADVDRVLEAVAAFAA